MSGEELSSHDGAVTGRRACRPAASAALLPGLLAAFFLCAVSYSVVIPLWEGPDESEHFQYVRYLLERRAPPTQLPTIQPDGNNEGKQPPLYYLLALPLVARVELSGADRIRLNPHAGWQGAPDAHYSAVHGLDEGWPYHGVFLAGHGIRLLSALLGVLTVAITYAVARLATGSRRLGLAAAALVACLPGFLFASSTINNDALADTLGAALLYLALRVCRGGSAPRYAFAFGIVGCLALLTKLSLVVPIALGLPTIIAAAGRGRARIGLLAAAPLLPALGFWAWRVSQGERSLIGRTLAWPPKLPAGAGPISWSGPTQFIQQAWTSFFGLFGWTGHTLPDWLVALYGLAFLLGLAAAAWPGIRPALRGRALLWTMPALFLAAMVAAALAVSEGGLSYGSSRLLYPALPAMATLVVYGWGRLVTSPAWRGPAAGALALDAVAAFLIPWLFLRPFLPTPWPVSDHLAATAMPISGVDYANTVSLAGVNLPAGRIGAGQGVYLTFYWRVQRPLPAGEWLFVHVENAQGDKAAAFDGPPSASTLPLGSWRPGDVIIEREVLTFHQDAASGSFAVKVGWYDPKTGARLSLVSGGNTAVAGTVQVAAAGTRSVR